MDGSPSYSSTNPRSRDEIFRNLSTEHAGYLTREPLSGDQRAEFIESIYPTGRYGRPLPTDECHCYELGFSRGRVTATACKYTTGTIFKSKYILPYSLSSTDYKKLTSSSGEYASKFSPDQRGHLYNKLKDYYGELQHVSNEREVFKLTDEVYIDDLGRFYVRKSGYRGYVWEFKCYNINFGRGTHTISKGDVSITLPLYGWTGLAGLKREVKCRFLAGRNIDFHHVEENLWDIRPSRIIPLPVAVHRWVHSNVYDIDKYRYFFGDE